MNWYKVSQQQKTVSFDFDGTLYKGEMIEEDMDYRRDPITGKILGEPNQEIISIMRQHAGNGWKVIIVSSRYDNSRQEIEDFVREQGLPVQEIFCTNGKDKVFTLMALGALKHYDDDVIELSVIRSKSQIEAIQV